MRKRNIQVMTHLNAKEYQALMKKVKKTGLSREAYVRQLMNGYAPKELPPPDYHGMMRELNAIGNSINQIAARANTTGFFTRIPLNSGISQGAMSQAAARDAFLAEKRRALMEIGVMRGKEVSKEHRDKRLL